jgi:hypothetical protein
MIVWINGAFGAGKSTTAALLADRVPNSRLFDPEYVGYLLTTFVDAPTGDFQDLPLWRSLTVETMKGLDRTYDYTWIAPMSLIRADYRSEILGGLRAAGVDVREFVLTLPEAVLRNRIDEDRIDVRARRWRQDHARQAVETFANNPDLVLIDAIAPAAKVADEIAAALNVV